MLWQDLELGLCFGRAYARVMLWQGLGEGYALAGPRGLGGIMLWQGLGEGYALARPRRGLCFGRA